MFSVTTQSGEKDYSEMGVNGTIEQNLFHLSTAFRFVGYDILKPFVMYNVTDKSKEMIANELSLLRDYILDITRSMS